MATAAGTLEETPLLLLEFMFLDRDPGLQLKMTVTASTSIDTELDLLFQKSNSTLGSTSTSSAAAIINDLIQPKKELEVGAKEAKESEVKAEGAEEASDHVTRKQRKELRSDSEEKTARTLFLGNLPVNCATDRKLEANLKKKFSLYGAVESIRFRSIPFTEPQARRTAFIQKKFRREDGTCNGYLVMGSRDAALEALKENATVFADRHLRVDLASSSDSASNSVNTKKSIFIGNLPIEVEEEPIWRFFQECGSVINVRLIRDRVSNLGKGFGYVTFASKDTVSVALQLNGADLQGRPVRISPCCKVGMVEKKRGRKLKWEEDQKKRSAALIKTTAATTPITLGGVKRSPDSSTAASSITKKLSKKEVKLQAELKTKFGQVLHKKFPFAAAISQITAADTEKKSHKKSEKKSDSGSGFGSGKSSIKTKKSEKPALDSRKTKDAKVSKKKAASSKKH